MPGGAELDEERRAPLPDWPTNEAEVEAFAACRAVVSLTPDPHQPAIGPGQPHGARSGGAERRDQTRIDAPRQDADDHIERRRVRDAQAVDRSPRYPEARHVGIDLAPASVHDDERFARRHTPEASGQPSKSRWFLEQLTAKLDHHGTRTPAPRH